MPANRPRGRARGPRACVAAAPPADDLDPLDRLLAGVEDRTGLSPHLRAWLAEMRDHGERAGGVIHRPTAANAGGTT